MCRYLTTARNFQCSLFFKYFIRKVDILQIVPILVIGYYTFIANVLGLFWDLLNTLNQLSIHSTSNGFVTSIDIKWFFSMILSFCCLIVQFLFEYNFAYQVGLFSVTVYNDSSVSSQWSTKIIFQMVHNGRSPW